MKKGSFDEYDVTKLTKNGVGGENTIYLLPDFSDDVSYVDITEFTSNESIKSIAEAVNNKYGLDLECSDGSVGRDSEYSTNGLCIDCEIEAGKEKNRIITLNYLYYANYQYMMYGIYCGMQLDDAIKTIERNGFKDVYEEEDFEEYDEVCIGYLDNTYLTVQLFDGSDRISAISLFTDDGEDDEYYEEYEDDYDEDDYDGEDELNNDVETKAGDYLLPNSDSKRYSLEDLKGFTKDECRIARNEIYARHGRIFDDEILQEYFEEKSWYDGYLTADEFDESVLSKTEKDNIDVIIEYEKSKGWR